MNNLTLKAIEFANLAMNALIAGTDGMSRTLPVYGRDFRFLRADGTPLPHEERPGVRALRGERVHNLQLILRPQQGAGVPVAVHAVPLHDETGVPQRTIVFVQDVTQVRQAEQLKDDFLALVSHELRTPLSAIHGGARVLRNKPHLDAETRAELLHDVVTESERLERLLSNLLALTEITAGRLQAELEPVLLEPLVTTVVAEFCDRHGIKFVVIERNPTIVLRCQRGGTLIIEGDSRDAQTLRDYVAIDNAKDPQPEIHVDAHRRVPYVYVANVLFTLQRGGLQKVGFVSGEGAPVPAPPAP